MSKTRRNPAYRKEHDGGELPDTAGGIASRHGPLGVVVKKEPNPMRELGDTGLSRWGGRVSEEWLTELKDARGRKVISEMMDNDPVISAMLRALEYIVRGVKWQAQGESDEQVEFLESCLGDMSFSWEDTLSEILSFIPFGWAYLEVVYKYRKGSDVAPLSKYSDGLIGWRKFAIRAQTSLFEWMIDDEDGGILGMRQQLQTGAIVDIPIGKALLFRTELAKNNPEGKSLLRSAYRPWLFKKNLEEVEGIGIERTLAGMPIVYLGTDCTQTGASSDLAVMTKIVRDVRRDEQEGIVIPRPKQTAQGTGILFELLGGQQRSTPDIGAVVSRYEKRMAMSLLAQWLMLGMDQVGSYALSQDQSDFFRQAVGAILKIIASTINRYAVPRLFALNPALQAKSVELPELIYSLPVRPSLADYAAAVNAMVGAQILNPQDEDVRGAVREALGLPEEEKQPVDVTAKPATTTPAASGAQESQQAAEGGAAAQDMGGAKDTAGGAPDVTKEEADFTPDEQDYARVWLAKAQEIRKGQVTPNARSD